MFGLGATEMIILLIIVLIVFGGGKIAGVGRSLGSAISEFKEAVDKKDDPEEIETETASAPKSDEEETKE